MADIEKRTVQIDLEVDTKTVDSSKNPYQGWIHMARAVDAWRIFPRLFLSVYAKNYNVLAFENGKAGILFSN